MYHKHLVDDRVRSAIKAGLHSQETARAIKAMRRPGPLRRLFSRLTARLSRQEKQPALQPQQTSLSRSL